MEPVDLADVALLLRLVLAHVLTDFALQRAPWVEERARRGWASIWLYVHSGVAAVLAYLFAGLWSAYWIPPVIFVSHLLLDRWKSEKGDTTRLFLLDQVGHLAVLLALWAVAVELPWAQLAAWFSSVVVQPALWVVLLSYAAVIWPTAIFVNKFTTVWRVCCEEEGRADLAKAGLWIGRLERFLALTAILGGRAELVGVLLAAKAIFKCAEARRSRSREESAYTVVGTLLSFAVAVAVGVVASWLLRVLPPVRLSL